MRGALARRIRIIGRGFMADGLLAYESAPTVYVDTNSCPSGLTLASVERVMDEEEEDSTDIFDTSIFGLYSIPPIAFSTSSPNALHTYNPPWNSSNPTPVELRLPRPPPALYTTLQANNLWLAAIYLADLICTYQINVARKRVAELGAGAGLPGVVACREGAEAVSSDWGVDEVLDVIRDNFDRTCRCGKWAVVGHQWGTDPTPLLNALGTDQRFDILLLADTLWVTEAHSALLDSIFALLEPGGSAQVTAGLHTGRGPLERFITSAKSRRAIITLVREVRWRPDGGWDEYIPAVSSLEEERGVVVYLTLQIP